MSQPFRNILCPVDLDDQFRSALDLAAKIVQQNGGLVRVLHVVSDDAHYDEGWGKGATIQLQRQVDERLKGNVEYEFIVRRGSAAPEVLRAVKEFESDLIVIPTHGRAGLRRLVLGSVAETVIREASVPVLTVRAS